LGGPEERRDPRAVDKKGKEASISKESMVGGLAIYVTRSRSREMQRREGNSLRRGWWVSPTRSDLRRCHSLYQTADLRDVGDAQNNLSYLVHVGENKAGRRRRKKKKGTLVRDRSPGGRALKKGGGGGKITHTLYFWKTLRREGSFKS